MDKSNDNIDAETERGDGGYLHANDGVDEEQHCYKKHDVRQGLSDIHQNQYNINDIHTLNTLFPQGQQYKPIYWII